MPWTNSREAGLGRGDGVVTLGLLVFPPAFFLLPTEVRPPFVFFSAASFFGATFLAALGLPMAFSDWRSGRQPRSIEFCLSLRSVLE